MADRELLLEIRDKIDAHTDAHKDIDKRLSSLEQSRAYATGAVAVLASVSGFALAYVKGMFGGSH